MFSVTTSTNAERVYTHINIQPPRCSSRSILSNALLIFSFAATCLRRNTVKAVDPRPRRSLADDRFKFARTGLDKAFRSADRKPFR